jgi:plastocyanin
MRSLRTFRLALLLLLVAALTACEPADAPPIVAPESPTPGEALPPADTPTPMATLPAIDTPPATPPPEETPVTPEPAVAEMVVGLELLAEGFTAPLALVMLPDDSGRFFIVDQVGVIHIISAEGQVMAEPFLDLSHQMVSLRDTFDERGLLGFALHPQFSDNGRFFVYYSAPLRDGAPADWDHTAHIAEFRVSDADPNVADLDSERIIMQIDQPQFNHNAGSIAFGPDGYLYIPLGDGGGRDDVGEGHVADWYDVNEGGNAQNRQANLLGSILRIDIDVEGTAAQPYGIPDDNPFVGEPDMADTAEIWAYGLRNPWRMTFDMAGDRQLFAADAGQDWVEEVNIITAGGNYGWNVKEGTTCFNSDEPQSPRPECPDETPYGAPLIDPIIEYAHLNQPDGLGLVVVGGYVYRGNQMPGFAGHYIFGDWSRSFSQPEGQLFVAAPPANDGQMWSMRQLEIAGRPNGELGHFVLSFGQDLDGEVYVLTTDNGGPTGATGRVYRLVPADPAATVTEPETATPSAAVVFEVSMDALNFIPAEITVAPGDTVHWLNNSAFPHTVTAGERNNPTDLFDAGTLEPGESFSFTFDEAGTYNYFCAIHSGMDGVVTVEASE